MSDTVQNQSGGADLNAGRGINVGGDVVGRDKIESHTTTNPGKRLTLAHEALATSPDCADAYVLLAEEEADTVGRAMELYRQGGGGRGRAVGGKEIEAQAGRFL